MSYLDKAGLSLFWNKVKEALNKKADVNTVYTKQEVNEIIDSYEERITALENASGAPSNENKGYGTISNVYGQKVVLLGSYETTKNDYGNTITIV